MRQRCLFSTLHNEATALGDDLGKLLLRVIVAWLMFFHGVDKLVNGLGHVQADLHGGGLPRVLAYGVYVGEVIAPLLILVGAWTRIAAVVYAGTIAVGVLLVHAESFTKLAPTGGWAAELYVFYVLTPLAVALLGGGRYSLRHGPWE